MIANRAEVIAGWLVKNRTIKKSEQILYQYAIENFFLFLSTIVLAIGVGLILRNVMQSIVLITPFMCLRKFSGGYHAKSLKICLLSSSLLMFLSLKLSMKIHCNQELIEITVLSAIILMVFSPVENPNRVIERQEKKTYQKTVIVLTMVFLLLAIITYSFGLEAYTRSICIGIQLSATLQIPCILMSSVIAMKSHGKTTKNI